MNRIVLSGDEELGPILLDGREVMGRVGGRGCGTQVVKGEVCKTSMHRFESDPHLHFSLLTLCGLGGIQDYEFRMMNGGRWGAFELTASGCCPGMGKRGAERVATGKVKIKYTAGSAAKRRADHALENAEDYVELIEEVASEVGAAHITDIAKRLGVSHVTVHKTIKRLKTRGLVHSQPHRAVALTESGKAMARQSRERHEITLRFLQTLGISESAALNDAEGLEHHVGEELLEKMSRFCKIIETRGLITREELQGGEAPEGEGGGVLKAKSNKSSEKKGR